MDHGLFGCINGKHMSYSIDNLNDTIKYVQQKSQTDKCIIYHGFISLKAEEVISQNYQKRSKWEELLSAKMSDVAKVNNIKIENLEWISALHMKKDQSHCHIIFWDKKQEIKEPHIPKKIFEEKMEWVRGKFAKVIFNDVFKELYKQKDEAFRDMKSAVHPFFNDFNTIINDMGDEDYKIMQDELASLSPDYADEIMYNPLLSDRQIQVIAKEILHIKDIVPKKGALKYQFMLPDIKSEIDKSALSIIDSNAACKSAYHTYIDTSQDIRMIYSNNPDSIKEAREYAHSTILKSVGNLILKSVGELKHIERNISSEEWNEKQELYLNETAGNLIISIASLLSRGTNSNKAKVNRLRNGELSKQAVIELAQKRKDRSIDWGQNEK